MGYNHQNTFYDVIIVGAGAAGLIAAGTAAESGAKVLVVEKMKQAGRKLLITGKGRCNITNISPESNYYKNIFPTGRFLKHAFREFFTGDIIELLQQRGVKTVTERGNRVFPASDSSADVLKALTSFALKENTNIIFQASADKLLIDNGEITGVSVHKNGGSENISSGSVIICTGGKSYPATGSTGDGYKLARQAGHTITLLKPALVPLTTGGNIAERLQGLSLKNANAIVWVNGKKCKEEFGELMFTHYGLSGPVILTLSRYVVDEFEKGNRVEISIDLKPALDENKLDLRLQRDLNEYGKKQIVNIFKLWLPSKLIPVFIDLLKIEETKQGNQVSAKERKKIQLLMKDFRFEVAGDAGFKEAVITSGGVPTTEIISKTMESKLTKNLYFAGEVIDLDGNTGGYNLQIAFSTGWLAGQESVKK